jgi:transcriptional regulator with XRE-family HTH domain|tara:strand:+ start:296 stop:508 length:213 start_codon:yes stop_codon:yes gene_type:complete
MIDTRRFSPLVDSLKQIIKESGRTNFEIAEESGVSAGTLSAWFHRHNPSLPNFESVLRELGYSLKIVKDD